VAVVNEPPSAREQLLRGLAAGDEALLRSVLAISPSNAQRRPAACGEVGSAARDGSLPQATSSLVILAALLAAGGSTTSLRWAVELAAQAGVHHDDVIEVLLTVAAVVGSARVVAAAPRLALAIGYDIEVEGWDGY
jgi:alkylhydroperoxidase/carboxymuconolactone decarboxylase family protein YurZ